MFHMFRNFKNISFFKLILWTLYFPDTEKLSANLKK